MLDLALFPSIYAVISEQAGKRGYKSPLYGAAGVVIFTFLSGCIEHVIDSALSPDTFVLLVMRLVIGATSSIVVVVLFLRLLPYGNSRTTRKASLIPYSLIGLATLVLAGVNAWHWADEVRDSIGRFGGLNPAWLPGLALSWLLFASSLYCFRLFRQQRLPTLDEELKRDPRPPILLLRSFAVDSVRPPPLWAFLLPRFFRNVAGLSFDDFLASSVRKRLGPFVGLGDPNDYLPTPGVTRVYQDDANWQDAVLDLVRRAGAVILVEGSTPGFRWGNDPGPEAVPTGKGVRHHPAHRIPSVRFGEIRDIHVGSRIRCWPTCVARLEMPATPITTTHDRLIPPPSPGFFVASDRPRLSDAASPLASRSCS